MDDIYSLKIHYLDEKSENIHGMIDYEYRVVRIIELNNDGNRPKIKGFINFNAIKKVDIIAKIA